MFVTGLFRVSSLLIYFMNLQYNINPIRTRIYLLFSLIYFQNTLVVPIK